jgi:hypothetical protein
MTYRKTLRDDPSFLFELRFNLSRPGYPCNVTIRAWENQYGGSNTHTRIDTEMRCNGEVIFAKGDTYCGIPGHKSIDGKEARECVTSLFCMKPGDTDADYFADYTEEQLEWVNTHAEDLYMAKCARYGWEE